MRQLKIAFPAELRERLEAAAQRSGKSLAEEIRVRLEVSCRGESADKPTQDFLAAVARLMEYVERQTGWPPFQDPFAMNVFRAAIAALLDRVQPVEAAGEPPRQPVPIASSKDPATIGGVLEALAFGGPDVIGGLWDATGYRDAAAIRDQLIKSEVNKVMPAIRRRGPKGRP